jgi:hypothetical protein
MGFYVGIGFLVAGISMTTIWRLTRGGMLSDLITMFRVQGGIAILLPTIHETHGGGAVQPLTWLAVGMLLTSLLSILLYVWGPSAVVCVREGELISPLQWPLAPVGAGYFGLKFWFRNEKPSPWALLFTVGIPLAFVVAAAWMWLRHKTIAEMMLYGLMAVLLSYAIVDATLFARLFFRDVRKIKMLVRNDRDFESYRTKLETSWGKFEFVRRLSEREGAFASEHSRVELRRLAAQADSEMAARGSLEGWSIVRIMVRRSYSSKERDLLCRLAAKASVA